MLPEKLIVGYASWSECDERVLASARQGVNVLVWFAINLAMNGTGHPAINGGPDLACVRSVRARLEAEGLPTVHMISVGGWDAPRPPDGAASADQWWEVFDAWNRRVGGLVAAGGLFDGLDWDLEGSDAPMSVDAHLAANTLSVASLNLMGELSVRAKQEGMLVSLAPPQSYFTGSTGAFNRTALLPPLGWPRSRFRYSGRNSYAYLVARYGRTQMRASSRAPELRGAFDAPGPRSDLPTVQPSLVQPQSTRVVGGGRRAAGGKHPARSAATQAPFQALERVSQTDHLSARSVRTFDWVFVQVYESWSLAHAQLAAGESFEAVLCRIVVQLDSGWRVDFGSDPELGYASREVRLPPTALVIGLANAWAAPRWPSASDTALLRAGAQIRAFERFEKRRLTEGLGRQALRRPRQSDPPETSPGF
ncbi:hypothetical protein T492DRAFT_475076 [Pavlovales sp. CCMP2436]|nr:hypothetical protein T492DRAFT_475076 [Pavlovales sp. CCMP2436]